jgi:hypothetical protein
MSVGGVGFAVLLILIVVSLYRGWSRTGSIYLQCLEACGSRKRARAIRSTRHRSYRTTGRLRSGAFAGSPRLPGLFAASRVSGDEWRKTRCVCDGDPGRRRSPRKRTSRWRSTLAGWLVPRPPGRRVPCSRTPACTGGRVPGARTLRRQASMRGDRSRARERAAAAAGRRPNGQPRLAPRRRGDGTVSRPTCRMN